MRRAAHVYKQGRSTVQYLWQLKPVRDRLQADRGVIGNSLKSLADAILAEQNELNTSQRLKLPRYGTNAYGVTGQYHVEIGSTLQNHRDDDDFFHYPARI